VSNLTAVVSINFSGEASTMSKLFMPFLTQFYLFYKSEQTNFPHKYKRSGKFIFFQR